jgi:hypothetical protein
MTHLQTLCNPQGQRERNIYDIFAALLAHLHYDDAEAKLAWKFFLAGFNAAKLKKAKP